MARSTMDRFIVNPTDEEPAHYWRYDRTMRRFDFAPGRRGADRRDRGQRMGFEVFYVHAGVVHKSARTSSSASLSGDLLVLEVKGREREQDRTKRRFLDEWTAAVNEHGGFGRWTWAVSRCRVEEAERRA